MDYQTGNSLLFRNQKGSALILVLLVTTILLVIGTAALDISYKTRESGDLEEKKTQALYIAESGINTNIEDIKTKIHDYLEDKSVNPEAEFPEYTIPEQSLTGGYYKITLTIADPEENEFKAVSEARIRAKNGEDVKKKITMKFIPQDSGKNDIPSGQPESPGGEQKPKLAEVFNYGVFSNDTFELESNASIDSYPDSNKGNVATNDSIILKSNATIKGNAYFGKGYTCSSNAEIKGEKTQITSPISVPADNTVIDLKPNLNYAGGTSSDTQTFKNATQTLNNYIFTNSVSVENATMTFNNCKFNGDINSSNSSNVTLTNSTIDGSVDFSSNSTVTLNNCVINEDLNLSSNSVLNISGIIWVEGEIEFDSNIDVKGTGIIISKSRIDLTSNVDAYQNNNTNVAFISLFVSNPNNEENSAIKMDSSAKAHGVLFAPNGFVYLKSNSEFYGSVVGEKVKLESNAKVKYDQNLPNTQLTLPGTTYVETGGGTPDIPAIAGVKVIEWKEN